MSDKSLTANRLNFWSWYIGTCPVSTRTEHFKFDFIDISKSDGASPIEIILSEIRLNEFATKFADLPFDLFPNPESPPIIKSK